MAGNLHEYLCAFMIIHSSVLFFRIIYDSDKIWREKHILYSVTFFPQNRAICETMWKNPVQLERQQTTK